MGFQCFEKKLNKTQYCQESGKEKKKQISKNSKKKTQITKTIPTPGLLEGDQWCLCHIGLFLQFLLRAWYCRFFLWAEEGIWVSEVGFEQGESQRVWKERK